MKRGDVILVLEPTMRASKARPDVVVQRDSALDAARRVTGCPLTSQLRGTPGQRPFVAPSSENGLRAASEIQVDLIYTHPIERIGGVVGTVDPATMQTVDQALRRWLNL